MLKQRYKIQIFFFENGKNNILVSEGRQRTPLKLQINTFDLTFWQKKPLKTLHHSLYDSGRTILIQIL